MIRLTLRGVEFTRVGFIAEGKLLTIDIQKPYTGKSRAMRLWDLATNAAPQELSQAQQENAYPLFLTNGAVQLRSQGLWSGDTVLPPPTAEGDPAPLALRPYPNSFPLCFHPDGVTVVFSEYVPHSPNRVYWRDSDASLRRLHSTRDKHFFNGRFSPSGKRLVLQGWNDVLVWNVPVGRRSSHRLVIPRLAKSAHHNDAVFLGDDLIAVATAWTVRIWDLAADRIRKTLTAFQRDVSALAISPDGRRFMAGSQDGTVRVWDAANFDEVARYDWQVGEVNALAFAPDGLTAAVAGDGGVVVWDVE